MPSDELSVQLALYDIFRVVYMLGISLLCFYFYLFCYATALINFTYYAQYYAHVKDLCLGIWTVLLEYIHLQNKICGECSIRVYQLIFYILLNT